MKLVRWEFNSLQLPMIEDDEQELYCTSAALCKALGMGQDQLDKIYKKHKNALFPVRPSDRRSNELKSFIKQHRGELHVARVREDMLLWPIDEALCVALYAHSEEAVRFHREAIRLIRQHAKQSTVSRTEYEALLEQVADLRCIVLEGQKALQVAASAAGSTLNAHKGARHLLPN